MATQTSIMIKLLRQLGSTVGKKLVHDPKLAAKVRSQKSTFHLGKGGFKGGKWRGTKNVGTGRGITANMAAKRMKQRGDNPISLYTSSSGRHLDSSEASARFAGRRIMRSTVNPYMGPSTRKSFMSVPNYGYGNKMTTWPKANKPY